MSAATILLWVSAVLGAASLALLLAFWKRGATVRAGGIVLGAVGLGLFLGRLGGLHDVMGAFWFYALAVVTVVSAVATITMRKPVYSAIWFGMTLLGVAGLLLFQGAQFLAVATIVVYAGAILVTFLFVLILAQPEGRAAYDRKCNQPFLSAVVGAALVVMLSTGIGGMILDLDLDSGEPETGPSVECLCAGEETAHVARLGTELFTRHLVTVEVAGVMLFIAMVGATAISESGKKRVKIKRETKS